MLNETSKISLIVNKMTSLFLSKSINNIDIKIKTDISKTQITIYCYECNFEENFVKNLVNDLNTHRQCEFEECFWEISDKCSGYDELYLIGTMIDEVQVKMEGSNLILEMIRNKI